MKPRILVSQCLEFDACRYDGQKITDKVIKQISSHIEFLPICPEVEIGMGIPREPICLVNENGAVRLKQPATKTDFTDNNIFNVKSEIKKWFGRFNIFGLYKHEYYNEKEDFQFKVGVGVKL